MCASTSVPSPIATTIRNMSAVYNLRVARRPRRKRDLEIVFEDKDLIVVSKPPGLLAVPLERRAGAPSVFDRVEDHLRPQGKRRPLVVHRIDRDTSGLVIFAKHAEAQARLKAQMDARQTALESGVLTIARTNAEKNLKAFLLSLGFEKVEFRWDDLPSRLARENVAAS